MWTGARWRFDDTLLAFDLARAHLPRGRAPNATRSKTRRAIASAKTVAAVERLARADRRLAATVDQWDADPWLLNTPGGVVDLRTGELRPHAPDDYMTKITAVAPGGDCPLLGSRSWIAITGGDDELSRYLQRMLGYALTGVTREQALFFATATGANGKSVLLRRVAGILGDYHQHRADRDVHRHAAASATRPSSPACAARGW